MLFSIYEPPLADPSPPGSRPKSDHGLPEPHAPDSVAGRSIDLGGPPDAPPLPPVDLARPPAQRPVLQPGKKPFDPRVVIPMDLLDPRVLPTREVQAQRRATRLRRMRIALGIAAGVIGGAGIGAAAILISQWQHADHRASEIGVSFAVASAPYGAAILIDGKPTGLVTPTQLNQWDFSVPHELTFTLRDYYPEKRIVAPGLHPDDLDVQLAKLAHVSLSTEPEGASIEWGDRDVGVTPFSFDVPAERDVDVILKLGGHLPVSQRFRLKAGEEAQRTLTLHSMSTLILDTEPAGAKVSVDGQKPVAAPAEVDVEAGVPHHLQFEFPGLPTQNRSVTLKDGQRLEMKVHFEDPRDRGERAELNRVRARLATAQRQLAAIQKKGSSNEFFSTVHRLHNEDQLSDEIDRLETREQELVDELGNHEMELEDRIKGNNVATNPP